ncbi:MAG: hypothetical protein V3U14_08145 [candidate division NC10 bacterium]
MIETQERIECPTCLGGTKLDYALNPCPQCWGALKLPQVYSPVRTVVGRLYETLRTGVRRLTEAVRSSPSGDQES